MFNPGRLDSLLAIEERGKSALTLKLSEDLVRGNSLCINIESYKDFPTSNNRIHFYKLFITRIVEELVYYLMVNKGALRKLSKEDKKILSVFIKYYYRAIIGEETRRRVDFLTKVYTKQIWKKLYNQFLNKPLNMVLSGASNVLSDTIRKSFALPAIDTTEVFRSYLPEATIIEGETQLESLVNSSESSLFEILRRLSELTKKIGIKSIALFLDRIDEYDPIDSDVNKICAFVEDLGSDINLLQIPNIGTCIVLWDRVFEKLKSSSRVRFDKFGEINTNWNNEDLRRILDKRLSYYRGKSVASSTIFSRLDEIIDLSNCRPRDAIAICNEIFKEHDQNNIDSTILSDSDYANAFRHHVRNFSYQTYCCSLPLKPDLLVQIRRLSANGKVAFTYEELRASMRASPQLTSRAVNLMVKSYGLVRESHPRNYEVTDRKLSYAISNGISI